MLLRTGTVVFNKAIGTSLPFPAAFRYNTSAQAPIQSAIPSLFRSASLVPQPQLPGEIFSGSLGQPSLQSADPSLSLSVSITPQPQIAGSVFNGSNGQPSVQ